MKDSKSYRNSNTGAYIYIPINILVIGFLIWTYTSGRYDVKILIGLIVPVLYLVKWIRILLDKDIQLSIGDEGVFIKKHGLILWENIERAEVNETTGKNSKVELEIEFKKPDSDGKRHYTFDLLPLNIEKSEISKALRTYEQIESSQTDEGLNNGGIETEDDKKRSKYWGVFTKRNRLYVILYLLGVAGMLAQVFLFRKTFVELSTLVIITLSAGFLGCVVDYKRYNEFSSKTGVNMIIELVITQTICWGFISSSLFFLLNLNFTDPGTRTTEEFEIIEYASQSGSKNRRSKREPVVTINYHGKMKDIIFSHEFYADFGSYSSVRLTTTTGLFKYDVIEDQELTGFQSESEVSFSDKAFVLKCFISEVSSGLKLNDAYVVITSENLRDTLSNIADTLQFNLDYNNTYFLEFGCKGYDSKSMDFSTLNMTEEVIGAGWILPMTVTLLPTEGQFKNETVADWHYNVEDDTFPWYRGETPPIR